jgi:hypothetical protein
MYNGKLKKDQRIIKAAITGVLFLILLISHFYDPVNYKISDCSFNHITGFSCPGCGLSRSFHSVANMNLPEAFGFHLLGPVFFLLLLSVSMFYSYQAISGNNIKTGINKRTGKILVIAVLTIWFIYWITRIAGDMFQA